MAWLMLLNRYADLKSQFLLINYFCHVKIMKYCRYCQNYEDVVSLLSFVSPTCYFWRR